MRPDKPPIWKITRKEGEAMPIFEYRCLKCGSHFEKVQKTGEEGETKCPQCGYGEVKRELSSFSTKGAKSASDCFSGG